MQVRHACVRVQASTSRHKAITAGGALTPSQRSSVIACSAIDSTWCHSLLPRSSTSPTSNLQSTELLAGMQGTQGSRSKCHLRCFAWHAVDVL